MVALTPELPVDQPTHDVDHRRRSAEHRADIRQYFHLHNGNCAGHSYHRPNVSAGRDNLRIFKGVPRDEFIFVASFALTSS